MTKPLFQIVRDALQALHNDQVEYITINNLGLPHNNHVMQQALIALTLCQEQEEAHKKAPPEKPLPVDRQGSSY